MENKSEKRLFFEIGQYDYRCDHGQNFLMPYRITVKHEDGKKEEWNDMADAYANAADAAN